MIAILLLLVSCAEKMMEKPKNLIEKQEMVDILSDLAILNAAKSANVNVLKNNHIDPTEYVFNKYEIDSVQFVESDRYYASLPSGEYEAIYKAVEAKLEKEKNKLTESKKIKDSLRSKELKSKKIKDSLQ